MMYDVGIVIMRNENMIQLSWHNFHIALVIWYHDILT
jgi:hypothetical protein